MLLSTLGAGLLGNMLVGENIVRAGYGNKQGKRIVRAGHENNKNLIPPHPLTNFEIQQHYQKLA